MFLLHPGTVLSLVFFAVGFFQVKDVLPQVMLYGEKEEVPLSYSTYQRTYRKAFDFLGLTGRYTNHDFRSTFGTQLKESGMSSAMVADLMGHADTRMVETVYARSRHEGE